MKVTRIGLHITLLLIILLALGASSLQARADASAERVLVKFREGVSAQERGEVHRQAGGTEVDTIPRIDVYVVAVPPGQGAEKAQVYARNPNVLFAEQDHLAQAVETPNDPSMSSQWGLQKVQAPSAWDLAKSNTSISIAVLDTGVDLAHPDLSAKVVASANFTDSATANDVYGHGTHVAGIAAAATNNGLGVAGLGYNATVLNVKVLGDNGSGSYSWVANGVIWAADNGAQVINMSLGGSSASSTLESAVNYAWSKGVVVVAAAGNNGNTVPFYPAYYSNVIAVAATDNVDQLASFSTRGDWVDAAAPGVTIYSTLINNSYGYKSGTSMASPHVAGLAALVFTQVTDGNGNGLLNDEARAKILSTCDAISATGVGCGRINAYRAVQTSAPTPPPPAPTTGAIAGKVTDAATGASLAGATVTDGTRTATTDASGNYTIAGVPEGSYTVGASASGYISAHQTVAVVAGQTAAASFALATAPAAPAISGVVTDATNGAAIAGATVSDGTRSATTDATGAYAIANVPAGTYTVSASASGYTSVSQSVTVGTSSTASVNFALTRPMWVNSITFKVLGKGIKNLRMDVKVVNWRGDPMANAQVTMEVDCTCSVGIWTFTGTTGSNGTVSFVIQKAATGTYTATVTKLFAGQGGNTWDRDPDKGVTSESYTLK